MTLGLFPLNLVLFPGVQIPLHIFEPRYRALLNECMGRGSDFGINLYEHGQLQLVGCTVRGVVVTHRYSDGRLDVIVEGTGRHRVLSTRTDVELYTVADVEVLEDEPCRVDPLLLQETIGLHNKVLSLVFNNSEDPIDVNNLGNKRASFLMAPKCGLRNAQKQELLELNSENERLAFLHSHLTEIVPTISKAATIQRLVTSDGYLRAVE
ncbi:MAG: LON peptidase substrate-binding domain-containing protein [Bradyrhizobiaceae bacterium]|nr:LON peptidase substrate-binding domain-containing protein [Bradyrhizobiaceae bacterium]